MFTLSLASDIVTGVRSHIVLTRRSVDARRMRNLSLAPGMASLSAKLRWHASVPVSIQKRCDAPECRLAFGPLCILTGRLGQDAARGRRARRRQRRFPER